MRSAAASSEPPCVALPAGRTYTIVRRGRGRRIRVGDARALVALRTELELLRRFGAGAGPELVAVLDRRLTRLWLRAGAEPERSRRLADLLDMRAILCDAQAPTNDATRKRIDREFPGLAGELNMDSINGDSQEFREDVKREAGQEDVDNIDELLAAFEQAAREAPEEPQDADVVDALLAQAAEEADDDASGDASAMDEESPENLVTGFAAVDPDHDFQLAGAAPDGTPLAETIDAVAGRMSDSLQSAEQQLDALADVFGTAAGELSRPATEPAVDASQSDFRAPGPAAHADVEMHDPAAQDAPAPGAAAYAPTAHDAAAVNTTAIRAQLQQARGAMLGALDEVLAMLEQADQMKARAEQAALRAERFEAATLRAREAGQALADAEAQAAVARAALEAAQNRASAARQAWEQAQQQVSAAASPEKVSGTFF